MLKRKKDKLEYEFLPDALEVIETPPSKAGRFTIWLIVLLLTGIIVWSYHSEIDEVAIARGKFISDGRSKVVQSLVDGIVTEIMVVEGQKVEKDQLLFKLDTTLSDVDIESLEKEISTEQRTYRIYNALLKGGDVPSDDKDSSLAQAALAKNSEYGQKMAAAEIAVTEAKTLFEIETAKILNITSQNEEYQSQIEELKRLYEEESVEELTLAKLYETKEIYEEEEKRLNSLLKNGVVPVVEYEEIVNQIGLVNSEIEIQKKKIDMSKYEIEQQIESLETKIRINENEMMIQEIQIEKTKVNIDAAESTLNELEAMRKREFAEIVAESEKKITNIDSQINKVNTSVEFSNIMAPTAGTVQSIAQNTIGGIASPAQVLATIVPDDAPLIIEAYLSNRDIGFVHIGQEVTIKFDTFSFQRYGSIEGKIKRISPDAVDIENVGTVYLVYVEANASSIEIEGENIEFSPGMTVTAEIKTGKRKVISFFLDPIIKYADESLKVR